MKESALEALAQETSARLSEEMLLRTVYSRIVYNGVDESTPADLADRIIYSNLVCLYIGLVVSLAVWAAAAKQHIFLLYIDAFYVLGVALCLYLNRIHRYLAARRTLLAFIFMGLVLGCSTQGNAGHMEHFFLAVGVLAYSMFHPSERKSAIFFTLLSVVLYAFFVNRPEPLWDIDPFRARHGVQGLWVNQILYLLLYFTSLIGLSNAYGRAIKVIDAQRDKIFEQNRLSTVGAMAANMAHEVNTPLSALDMQVHTLLENLEGKSVSHEETIKIARKMVSISERISTLIRGYKFLSRSAGNEPSSHIAVSQMVDSVVDLCSGRLRKFNIQLEIEMPDPTVKIECRPVAISQVLLNLLNNAIDVVERMEKSKRVIRLTVHHAEGRVVFSVIDPGHIDSDEVKNKLFGSFFTTKPIGKGTGLGLFISRQSVEQNGGKLYLDSAYPTTRFVVDLPLTLPRQEPTVKVDGAEKLKILVVDDDADFVEILSIVLRRQGYTVLEASSGNRALEVLKANRDIQLILSDCYMDDGSGKELLTQVRALHPQLPLFFMITGQSDFSAQEALSLGAQEFIFKPINIPNLLTVIRSYTSKT